MNEHDDDLDSEVHEDAEEETDTFPNTADDFEPDEEDESDEQEGSDLDEDQTEL